MARSRNIKPALFKNEVLGVADPFLTILFASLWCLADKSGRLEDRPLRIKAETFPYRENIDINVYLTELHTLGFIRRYERHGIKIIQVINFSKHQHPHKTEADSILPEYEEESDSCSIHVKYTLNTGSRPADSLNTDSLNTEEPRKSVQKKETENLFHDVSEQTATDFKKLRAAKKAPVTGRVIESIRSEATKAGISLEAALIECCTRGWTSFKADWYHKTHAPPHYQTKQQLATIAARSIFGNETQERVINGEVIEHGTIAKQLG